MIDADLQRATVDRLWQAMREADRALYLSCFADNAVMEDPIGTPEKRSLAEIGAFFDALMTDYSRIRPTLDHYVGAGDRAAAKWSVSALDSDGGEIALQGIDFYRFDASAQIGEIRGFIG